jgi:hypothetical protein
MASSENISLRLIHYVSEDLYQPSFLNYSVNNTFLYIISPKPGATPYPTPTILLLQPSPEELATQFRSICLEVD